MRKAPRLSHDGPLPVSVLKKVRIPFVRRAVLAHGASQEDVFMLDLGLGGAFVERQAPIADAETAVLHFQLPGNEIPLDLACRVGWWRPKDDSSCLPSGVGLQFLEVSASDQARLEAFLSEYLGRQPEARRFHRAPSLLEEEP
jgi:Tfp pilus assembly protein PilZ